MASSVRTVADQRGDGDRRVVTIMFADISGFTALADHRDAEVVHDIINDCFSIIVPIIEHHGGTIDKFIGDCVMAVFGTPVAHENDAARSLDAALEILAAFRAFAIERELPLDLHFGINTGPVVSARIGYGAQQQFSVIGDAVNLAARLEDLSRPGEILIGQTTWDQTEGRFEFDSLPPAALKGKPGSVPVYRLIGLKEIPRARRETSTPFVGRIQELATLGGLLTGVARGEGAAVEIIGDAGVGKSRLVDELHGFAVGTRWIEVRGQLHLQAVGFGLARQTIIALADAQEIEDPLLVRGAIGAALAADADDRDAIYLATIVGLPRLPSDQSCFEDLPEVALQTRFAKALRRLLLASVTRGPVVLVCEDLHWVDRSSLDLLRGLAADGAIEGVFAIFTRRPDPDEAGAIGVLGAMPMPLEALSAEEANELLATLLSDSVYDEALTRLIVERAEGNPYFLEELVRSLREKEPRGSNPEGESDLPAPTALLPLTVQGVIMARIDRLYPAGRRALQTASIFGRSFDVEMLSLVAANEQVWKKRLPTILRDLHRRDFTRPNDTRATSYRFKHGLAQEVAYESMLRSRRRLLHRAAAQALASLFGENDELAPALAYHLDRADQPVEASVQFLRAGIAARRTHANAEASEHFSQVITLLTPLVDERDEIRRLLCEAHEGKGDLLLVAGRHSEAQSHFASALDLSDEQATTLRGSLLRRCGQARMLERDSDGASAFYDQALVTLEAVRDSGDDAWLAEWLRTNLDLLWPLYWNGELQRMQKIVDRVRDPVRQHGSKRQYVRLLDRETMLRLQIEGMEVSSETVRLARQAATIAEDMGGLGARTLAQQTLGYCLWLNGSFTEAITHHTEALRLSRLTGHADQETLAQSNLSIIYRLMNEPAACARHSIEMSSIAQRIENWIQVGVGHANLAWVALREGDLAKTRLHTDQAMGHWRHRTFRMQWLGLWPALALAIAENDHEALRTTVSQLLAPDQLQPRSALVPLLRDLDAALRQGDNPSVARLEAEIAQVAVTERLT